MINMEKLTKNLKDAIQLHIDRNELLKDSLYGEFAKSDSQMLDEIQEVYVSKLIKNYTKAILNRKL